MTLKIDSIGKPIDLDKLVEATKPSLATETAALRAAEVFRDIGDIGKRQHAALAKATAALSVPVGMENIFKDLANQRGLIADLARGPIDKAFVGHPPMQIPEIKNPLLETNERLAKIEKRFLKMEEIALKGAEIATGLQAYAAQFLQKFEIAATETDASARRAVRIGIIAIVIAVAVPAAQTAFEVFWDRPTEVRALAEAIEDLNVTIAQMQVSEAPSSESMLRLPKPARPVIEPLSYTAVP